MAVEARRGCGYRKIGALYMCANGPSAHCCKFPFPLHICPVCNQGVKQSRNVQWFEPGPFMQGECKLNGGFSYNPPMCRFRRGETEKSLLIWIGAKFYGTPESFLEEARRMGISRRVKSIPRGFELGKTQVFFAHPNCAFSTADGGMEYGPGVFAMVVPTRFELIVTDNPTPKQKKRLEDERITPVVVPDFDMDHHHRPVQEPHLFGDMA
jgi:hypothetical protein